MRQITLPAAPQDLSGPVKAWTEAVTIPTFVPMPPDRNPMFIEKRVYQGSSGRIYPLPFYDRIADVLSAERIEAAVALASVPSLIRGFGHVKAANATKAAGERERLMVRLNSGPEAAKTLQAAE